jgi:hypothetical protein
MALEKVQRISMEEMALEKVQRISMEEIAYGSKYDFFQMPKMSAWLNS